MRDEIRAEERVDELRGIFAAIIREVVAGIPPAHALQAADAVCTALLEQLAGARVNFRSLPAIDADAIMEDWLSGRTLSEIMGRHGCSRATAYNHHPTKKRKRAGA